MIACSLSICYLHTLCWLQYANRSPTHLKEGRGYLLFRLVNMRAPIIMAFLRGGKFFREAKQKYSVLC